MNVMVAIPDDLVARFGSAAELERRVLEALALEEYRGGRLTEHELQTFLGFDSRYELDGFLKARGVFHDYAATDLEQERNSLQHATENDRKAAVELVQRFKAFAARHTLGGLSIKELINEGRR